MNKSIAKTTVAALCLLCSAHAYADTDTDAEKDSLQFSAPTYTVAEQGVTASITVTRVFASDLSKLFPVEVEYLVTDDVSATATDGIDYVSTSGTLTFLPNVATQTFTIEIIDDEIYEGDETLVISLDNPSENATLGSPETAVLIIAENDPVPSAGSLQFSAPTYTVDENGAAALITVTRLNGSFGTVTVDYNTGDGTASAGSDYIAASGTLIFDDGVTSQTFSIDILDDAVYEGNETVNLSLSNPLGGAGLESPLTAVLTIAEDDPAPPVGSLQFSAPTYLVTEFGLVATITVERDGGSVGTVTVDYASSDGTATAGEDYVAVNGSLVFTDGETSRTFGVQIINDSDTQEGDETLDLILSNPTGGAGLGTPSTAILTITEKDAIFDGSGGGTIGLMTLLSLLALCLRGFRKRRMTTA